MSVETAKSLDNIDLETTKIAYSKEQMCFFKEELILKNNVGPEKPSFKEYEPYQVKAGESIYDIAKRERLMELTGKNIYDVCQEIKLYNIKNQTIDSNKKSVITGATNINRSLGIGNEYIRLPKLDEYKLTQEEIIKKDNYEKLFEGNDNLNISKNLERGYFKINGIDDVKVYIKEYQNNLENDGYNFTEEELFNQFKEYNKNLSQKAKKIGIKNVYDGGDNLVPGSKAWIPLYKHITEKTVVNDLQENEQYRELDSKETKALDDAINKLKSDKEKGLNKFKTASNYIILVNTLKDKGKHQVVLCDINSKSLVRRYICSTGNEPGGIYTPRGIFRIDDRKKGEGREMQTYWDGIRQNNGDGAIMPRACDSDGNFCASEWHGTGATMTARLMPLNISADIYFHGTNAVEKLGYFASHGCVRMLGRDVMELFSLVPPGTYVNIMDPSKYNK